MDIERTRVVCRHHKARVCRGKPHLPSSCYGAVSTELPEYASCLLDGRVQMCSNENAMGRAAYQFGA
jgi:hypothetical protein